MVEVVKRKNNLADIMKVSLRYLLVIFTPMSAVFFLYFMLFFLLICFHRVT